MNALAPSMQTQPIDYVGLWHKSRLSVHDVIEKDPEVLKVGDVTICTLGNFSASIGKAKSKKTFNLSAIVAAALKGDMVVNYTGCFPPDKNKILYVDTEQSDHHCNRVYKASSNWQDFPMMRIATDWSFWYFASILLQTALV